MTVPMGDDILIPLSIKWRTYIRVLDCGNCAGAVEILEADQLDGQRLLRTHRPALKDPAAGTDLQL